MIACEEFDHPVAGVRGTYFARMYSGGDENNGFVGVAIMVLLLAIWK